VEDGLISHACGHLFSTFGSNGQVMRSSDPCEDCANEPLTKLLKLIEANHCYWEHNRDCKPLSTEGCICGLWTLKSLAKTTKDSQ
jgi:hypothetical protein